MFLLLAAVFVSFHAGWLLGYQKAFLPVSNTVSGEKDSGADLNAGRDDSQTALSGSDVLANISNPDTAGILPSQLWEEMPELILVNKDYHVPDDYTVNLKTLPDKVNQASEIAYEELVQLLEDGRKEGMNFEICSSYRSVERQQELMDEDINDLMAQGYTYREAYNEVTRETMPPGYSEHSTGLAFDIVALNYQMLDKEQENTRENKWLREHCAEYGFILRYPKGKEEITGISYESWHFRYVGKEAAQYITEQGITLEEYLEECLEKDSDIRKNMKELD